MTSDTSTRTKTLMRILFGSIGLISLVIGVIAWRHWGSAIVTIEWSTASELDTAGFNLYRGLSPDGPYELINPSLIPSSDDPLSGDDYTYEDINLNAGEKYYYLLEDVDYSGVANRTEPIEVVAQGSAKWELVLAVLLAVISGYGLITTNARNAVMNGSQNQQSGLING